MTLRAPSVILASSLCTGCVGAQIYSDEHHSTRATLSVERARYTVDTSERAPSREEVLRAWGKPDRVEERLGEERWIYQDGWRWNGAVVFVLLPLPLMVPVGYHQMTLIYDGNLVSRIETVSTRSNAGGACFVLLPYANCWTNRDRHAPGERFMTRSPALSLKRPPSPE